MPCKFRNWLKYAAWFGATWVLAGAASAQQSAYSAATFWEDTRAVKWETGLMLAGATAIGLNRWNWGSRHSFHTTSEGWFGLNTGSGGTDKLGHAFTAYLITNSLTERLLDQGRNPEQAALSSALVTQVVMTYVEVFDGYSVDHGWSKEDVAMNLLGSGVAYLRQVKPGWRDKLDFRFEYHPSSHKDFSPTDDYEGQKYVLALKLSGFNAWRDTPLRYLELQTGYYTRGFTATEQAYGLRPSRHGFIGIGLNLSELLLGQRKDHETGARRAGRLFFEHIQLPHTAARSEW